MCLAGTIPRPTTIPPWLGGSVAAGARIGGALGMAGGAVVETSKDAIRAADEARTGRCSSGNKWDGSGDCNSCHPKKGSKRVINRGITMADKGEGSWWEYQLRVANLYAAPNVFNVVAPTIEEWSYRGVDFDGFWEKACTLVDAKANYSGLLKFQGDKIRSTWLDEAKRQLAAAEPMPPAKLVWYFMQNDVCQDANMFFLQQGKMIPCVYMP